MSTVSLGRSLIIRQLLLAGLFLALGLLGYVLLAQVAQDGGGSATLTASAGQAQILLLVATFAGCAVILGLSLPMTQMAFVRPLATLVETVERLAAGELAADVPGTARGDEIGALARAVAALRAMARASAAAASHDSARGQDGAMRALAAKVESFADDLGGSVRRLAAMTQRMTEASRTMIVAAHSANEGSDQAKTASANAAGDVSSVATASEQLLVSIEEISRQVVQSTTAVKNSVQRTVETNAGMNRLATAAQKVGDVVSLISRIAAQTNLLALNATIEAARAGEAGRGFAVVAQEVKTLATQTAKATQDITGQIAEIQQATDTSVGAIEKIQGKISEVEHISTLIAAAVHEQGAATQAIARNVRSAASGTATVSGHIEKVVRSVGETRVSATSVADLAREMDEIAGAMTEKVMAFTKGLKAA